MKTVVRLYAVVLVSLTVLCLAGIGHVTWSMIFWLLAVPIGIGILLFAALGACFLLAISRGRIYEILERWEIKDGR